jgi:hypothetical protein
LILDTLSELSISINLNVKTSQSFINNHTMQTKDLIIQYKEEE